MALNPILLLVVKIHPLVLFLAVGTLPPCVWALPGCGEGDYSLSQCVASHCSGSLCCRAQVPGMSTSVAAVPRLSNCSSQAQQLRCRGLAAPWHVGSS